MGISYAPFSRRYLGYIPKYLSPLAAHEILGWVDG